LPIKKLKSLLQTIIDTNLYNIDDIFNRW
jgi:hypothetical protein